MEITLRIKHRSKNRVLREQREGNSQSCEPDSQFDRWRAPQVDPARVPRVDVQPEIISGVRDLNQFFDHPKKLLDPAGKAASSSPGPLESIDESIQLDQIAVEEVQVQAGSRLIMHSDPRSPAAERFRFLRLCLRELWQLGKLRIVQITSPLPQEGKSTIALNLATALAEGGKRKVLLIEADLHRPTLSEQLGLKRGRGLAECLEEGSQPGPALRRLEPLRWFLLPAGEPRSNPTELLQTEAFSGLLKKLSGHFDWILIDSPPVLPLTDALSIARQANATLLVAREGHSPREAIERAIAILGRQRVLGVILNAVEKLDRLYSGYYPYGGYSLNNNQQIADAQTPASPRAALQGNHSIPDPPQ